MEYDPAPSPRGYLTEEEKKERKRAYSKMYYLLNRSRLLVKSRNAYDEHREELLAKKKAMREIVRREEGREKGRWRVLASRTHL